MEKKCNEIAKIQLPWGSNILQLCPCHANKMIILGKAMGFEPKAILLPETSSIQCGGNEDLTEEEKETNKTFSV